METTYEITELGYFKNRILLKSLQGGGGGGPGVGGVGGKEVRGD